MIVFRVLSGGKAGKIIKSDLEVLYIGRKPECILQLDPYQDLSVHGQHAKVYCSSNGYYLEDLQTKNGTFIDNEPIKVPVQLRQGIVFRLGSDGPEIEVYDCKIEKTNNTPIANNFQLKRLDTNTIFNFDQKSVRIGRQFDCELALDPIKNREVSGYHALICYREDGYYLEDLQSANGTFLNTMPSQNNKLQNGDIVQLGKDGPKFEFIYGSNSSPTTTAPIAPTTPTELDILNPTPVVEPPIQNRQIHMENTPQVQEEEEETPKARVKNKASKTKNFSNNTGALWQRIKEKSIVHLDSIINSDLYIKATNSQFYFFLKKHKKQTIVFCSALFLIIIIIFSFSRQKFDTQMILTRYSNSIVPVYCRYLVYTNGIPMRGQIHSNGIAYQENGKTFVIVPRESVYPWEKEFSVEAKSLEKLVHVVSVWPDETLVFCNEEPYQKIIDFAQSYNNDLPRLGGMENISIRDMGENFCQIVISSKKIKGIPQKNTLQFNQQVESNAQVYCLSINNDANTKLIKKVEKFTYDNFFLEQKIVLGSIIFNVHGEIIGIFSSKKMYKLP